MLTLNINRLLDARNIRLGNQYLREELGLSSSTATTIKLGRARTITLRHLELLCTKLKCTPNDLLEWQPDTAADTKDHPLQSFRRKEKSEEVLQMVQALPFEKLEQAKELLKTLS